MQTAYIWGLDLPRSGIWSSGTVLTFAVLQGSFWRMGVQLKLIWVNTGRKRILSFQDTFPVVLLKKFRDFLFNQNAHNAYIFVYFFSSFHNLLTNATQHFLLQAYSEDGETISHFTLSKNCKVNGWPSSKILRSVFIMVYVWIWHKMKLSL